MSTTTTDTGSGDEKSPTPRTPGLRLRFATAFTAHGERLCHDCGVEFVPGDDVTETRLHTKLRNEGESYFLHTTCWRTRTVGVFHPEDTALWDDTRLFTTEADHHLTIIVQTAACTDPGSGMTRLRRATYFVTCAFSGDPLFAPLRVDVVHQVVDVPVPSATEAARAHRDRPRRIHLGRHQHSADHWTGR